MILQYFLSNEERLCLKPKKRTAVAVLFVAWRRPALTGGNPQLPSALKSLTAVFGMGTGVTSSLMPPDCIKWKEMIIPSKLDIIRIRNPQTTPYG